MHLAINVVYPIFGDTPDEKVRQDLKISSLWKFQDFNKFER